MPARYGPHLTVLRHTVCDSCLLGYAVAATRDCTEQRGAPFREGKLEVKLPVACIFVGHASILMVKRAAGLAIPRCTP
jgi:hypothetical protein